MMMKYFTAGLIAIFFLHSCIQNQKQEQNNESSATPENTGEQQQLIENGIAISGELQQALAGHLKKAIEDSGAAYAINYCNLRAYPLTDSIAQKHGVKIKRVSHKARNPLNKADESELAVINEFRASVEKGEAAKPEIVESDGHSTFFAPIMIQAPLCLKCHGEPEVDIAPQDFIAIKMLYPNDEATGFKLNDLRGMWRIDFTQKQPSL